LACVTRERPGPPQILRAKDGLDADLAKELAPVSGFSGMGPGVFDSVNGLFKPIAEGSATSRYCARSRCARSTFMGRWEFGMRNLISRFLRDQSGATAIEYAIIAGGLSIVIVTAVAGIGSALNDKFTLVKNSFP
jgi:pilus assembly protein Flp/PilA